MHPAMRAEGPPFGSESLGPLRSPSRAYARSLQGRWRCGNSLWEPGCTRRCGPKDRRLAQDRWGRCAAHRRLHAGSLQGRWRYADHCSGQGVAGNAGRRTAVWLRIVGAAARPIAGCTPAPTKESVRQALASNHRISNQSAPRGDPVGAGEACEEAGPDTPRHSPHPLVAAP